MTIHAPEVEASPWSDQASADEPLYRQQIKYLFQNSDFYRQKLTDAGFSDADVVGGLAEIAKLPFTEKDDLRATRDQGHPVGTYLSVPMEDIVRIYSTSGTTGIPSYIPLTQSDLADWIEISSRSYRASGVVEGERIVTTYNAGPFVAGVTLDAFAGLGLCHIPVGAGNTERLMTAIQMLQPSVLACTPSYALHLAEWAKDRDIDIAESAVRRILCAGEPGGGEPALRRKIEDAWQAKVTEAMGIGDISVSLWGECEAQDGMHFSGRGLIHFELIDPDTGDSVDLRDGAEGELVYTHLRHRSTPLLRFRSRDRVVVKTGTCSCGRTSPRIRCIGRTDDMLIVRGVNVFPTALREVVHEFAPRVSGVISVRPTVTGVKQSPPLPIVVEMAETAVHSEDLAEQIARRIREKLTTTVRVELVKYGTLPRTDYKSKLIDWSLAR